MDSVDCERNTKCEKDEEVDYFGVENGDGPCHKSADFLLISHLKRVQPLNTKVQDEVCSNKNKNNALALIGPTSVQVLDDNGMGFSFGASAATAAELRRVACSFFVDCIINSVPIGRRKSAKKEIVDLMQNLGIISPDFFADTFYNARRPISLMISKFVVDFCQQHSQTTSMFSPNFTTLNRTVSINELSLMSSRYLTDFEEIEQLGVGGFGKVFKVRSKIDNQLYAVKQIRFKSTSESFSKVLSECRYHASLQSEHVVRYHNAWIEFETVPPHNSKRKSHDTGKISSGDSIVFYDGTSSRRTQPTAVEVLLNSSAALQTSNRGGVEKRPVLGGKFWQNVTESSSSSSSTESVSEWSRPNSSTSYCDDVKFTFEKSKNSSEDALVIHQAVETRKWNGRREGPHRKGASYGATPLNADLVVPVLYIQMELCGSTLERYLRERRTINEEFNHTIIFGLLSAIDFLHKNRLIHRDIKPSNVLMKRRNGRMCVLLGDFGLTREATRHVRPNSSDLSGGKTTRGLDPGYDYNRICRVFDGFSGGDSPKLTGGIGTAMYAAPEQIASKEYGPLVDVYSAGIVFFELFNCFSTFMERAVAVGQLRERCQPDDAFRRQWPMVSILIEKTVVVDPRKRHSAAQLLNGIRQACSKAAKKCADESDIVFRLRGQVSSTDCLRSRNVDGDNEISRLRYQNAELTRQLAELKRQLAELSGGGGRGDCSFCRKNYCK